MRLWLVPPVRIPGQWEMVRCLIEEALTRQNLTRIENVEPLVLGGTAELWLALNDQNEFEGAGVTMIEDGILLVIAWAGARDQLCLEKEMYAWARGKGCRCVRMVGPPAWGRILGPAWKPLATILERKL